MIEGTPKIERELRAAKAKLDRATKTLRAAEANRADVVRRAVEAGMSQRAIARVLSIPQPNVVRLLARTRVDRRPEPPKKRASAAGTASPTSTHGGTHEHHHQS